MAKRISRSFLDPYLAPLVPRIYGWLPIPRRFPPEGIVLSGHLIAMCGAIGFTFSTQYGWGGLLAAAGVAGNHLADMVDGTHARQTGQCRNGGELLDHFTDPLSFAYWIIGIAISCGYNAESLTLGLAAVVCLFATAVLTNIKAKITGEFELARFGPTEFKFLLFLYGLAMAALVTFGNAKTWITPPTEIAKWTMISLLIIGFIQLPINLVRAVKDANAKGATPDSSEWQLRQRKD